MVGTYLIYTYHTVSVPLDTKGLLGVATPNIILPLCNPNPNHCVAIVPKLQDLVLLQHQVSLGYYGYVYMNTMTLPLNTVNIPVDTVNVPLDTMSIPLDTMSMPLNTVSKCSDFEYASGYCEHTFRNFLGAMYP